MKGSAVISECEVYRYNLIRIWDETLPRVCFVLLNPSKADAQIDDNTLRRGIAFAKLWGYGSVEFVNLYAFRSTDPTVLKRAAENMDVIGPENDTYILEAARRAEVVVLAWGATKVAPERAGVVEDLLKGFGHELWCLGRNKDRTPKHPLRLLATTPLQPWDPKQKRSPTRVKNTKIENAVMKAMSDPGTNTVARRVVMRSAVWDLAAEITRELKKKGIKLTATEVLAVAQECGLPLTYDMVVKMQGATLVETVAQRTDVQNKNGRIYSLTLQDRADLYAAAFPDYPGLLADKGWLMGVWNIGNNYKGSGYHGAYPPSYLKRVTPMFPDQKRVLHLFSGSLPPGDYVRFDRRTDLPNGVDVVGEAEELVAALIAHYGHLPQFDIIYADPPYTGSDAEKYGTCLCNRNKVVKECAKLLAPGGFLIWMDQVLPMYRKVEWHRCIEIAISRSTNHRVRAVFGFQRKVDQIECNTELPPFSFELPSQAEQRDIAMEF